MKIAGVEMLGAVRTLWTVGAVGGLDDATLLGRYADRRDGPAFEAIVVRHGPMVRAVCRSLAADPHEADDLFQATFLVLARRAGSIRKLDSLGPWLHGVARRVAAEARSRRRVGSRGLEGIEPVTPAASPDLDAPAIHEEVGRLPRKYRDPIILCYLEGLTHDEAAMRLGWPVGTVRGRLARARDMLRPRLTKRGLASASILVAVAPTARGSVPRYLLDATTRSALLTAESATTGAMFLSQGVLNAMLMTKLKLVAAGLVGATLAAGGAGALIVRPERADGIPVETAAQDAPAAPAAPAGPAPTAAAPQLIAPQAPAPAPTPRRPALPPRAARRDPVRSAPPRRAISGGEATTNVIAEINEFRAKQISEVEAGINRLSSEIRTGEEEIREAEEKLDKARQEVEDRRAALRMMERLRDDLSGRPHAVDLDGDGDGVPDFLVDVEVDAASTRRPRPTARPLPPPDALDDALQPRRAAPRAEPGDRGPSDSDRITALERKLDRLFELIEGKGKSGMLRP